MRRRGREGGKGGGNNGTASALAKKTLDKNLHHLGKGKREK